VLVVRYIEIRAGEAQRPTSSASKFETGFEKIKRYKSFDSGKIDARMRQYIRLWKP